MRLKQELGLEDVMTFGEYKGLTIKKIIVGYPSYIGWAVDEAGIELDQEAAEMLDMYYDDAVQAGTRSSDE